MTLYVTALKLLCLASYFKDICLFYLDMWTVTPEDKAKHEQVFQSLNPVIGKLSGKVIEKNHHL